MNFLEVAKRLKILLEMADNRKDAIQYLRDQSRPYTTHICKYILWANQNENWEDDWSDEIYTFLRNVTNIWVKGGKRLKENDYLQNFFYYQLEAEWETEVRLEQTTKEYTQRHNYPIPNNVSSTEAFSKYHIFVNSVKKMVVDEQLDYEEVKESCKILKFS